MSTVAIRLDETQDKDVEALAKRLNIDKSSAVRMVIAEGLKVIKLREALENVRSRRWTIWKAAQYSGESFRSFLGIMRKEKVLFPLTRRIWRRRSMRV